MAPLLSGYAEMVNGLVTFISSPEVTRDVKIYLITTSQAAASGDISVAEASRRLDTKDAASGEIFRKWATLGS